MEKNMLEHEQQSMGGYVRIYPSTDWARDTLYKTLLKAASAVTLIGTVRWDHKVSLRGN